jgi:hypothetical protein
MDDIRYFTTEKESDKLAQITLTYNLPGKIMTDPYGDPMEDDMGEDVYTYSKGNYGKAIISLIDPDLFMIISDGKNKRIHEYFENGISDNLSIYRGEGPYDFYDILCDDIQEDINDRYQSDTGKDKAFIDIHVEYVNWDKKYKIIKVSKKLEDINIPGLSTVRLLKHLEKMSLF